MSTSAQPTAATDTVKRPKLPPAALAGRELPPAVAATTRRAGELIGRHPGMALAVAACLGVAVGWLVKRT